MGAIYQTTRTAYSFPTAAITNSHRLGDSTSQICSLTFLEATSLKSLSLSLSPRRWQGSFLSEILKGEYVSWSSLPPASKGCPQSLVGGPLLKSVRYHISCYSQISFCLHLVRTPAITFAAHPDKPGNSPHHKIPNPVIMAKCFLPCEVHSQVLEIRTWISLVAIIQSATNSKL